MKDFSPRYYDIDGKPMTIDEWSEKFQKRDTTIAKDTVDGYLISTVWLGLDHNHFGSPPLIFETMIFCDDGNFKDVYMERYSTMEEALKGHKYAVDNLSAIVQEYKDRKEMKTS